MSEPRRQELELEEGGSIISALRKQKLNAKPDSWIRRSPAPKPSHHTNLMKIIPHPLPRCWCNLALFQVRLGVCLLGASRPAQETTVTIINSNSNNIIFTEERNSTSRKLTPCGAISSLSTRSPCKGHCRSFPTRHCSCMGIISTPWLCDQNPPPHLVSAVFLFIKGKPPASVRESC